MNPREFFDKNSIHRYKKPLISWIHFSFRDFVIVTAAFLVGFAAVFGPRMMRLHQAEAVVADQQAVLYLDESISTEALPRELDMLDMTYDDEELEWAASYYGFRTFRVGRYEFEGEYSYRDFLRKLAHGLQDPGNVTIIPGVTKESFSRRIASQLHLEAGELRQTMQDTSFLAELGVEERHIFGRMLPDTYQMYWTAAPRQFLRRMVREFESRVVEPHRERMEELGKTPDEIVTLASIVELEAKDSDEKSRISGLYWNRLNNNWRLQADPTVTYAVGERRRLIYEDYETDHPYNTYQFRGLPPGPITNPSYAAIRAVLYPEDHDYFYMVATPEGTHAFSETYAEHRRKSREWTEWLREQRRIQRQQEAEAQQEAETSQQ